LIIVAATKYINYLVDFIYFYGNLALVLEIRSSMLHSYLANKRFHNWCVKRRVSATKDN
jgi:hypothetical protein